MVNPWQWVTGLLGDKSIEFTVDTSKNANRDLVNTVNKRKILDKSDQRTKTKSKSKDTNNGTIVHSQGGVTVVEGDVNVSVSVGLDKDGKISAADLQQLAPFTELFERKQVAFVAADEQKTLGDIRTFEDDSLVRGLLKFFKHRLNPNDYIRLRTGLYLKHLSDTGKMDQVKKYWNQVRAGQRVRDRRIIELASAGYFDTFFRPLYKQLQKANPETAQRRFLKEFDAILEDMRLAIFIGASRTPEQIYEDAVRKAISNIKYGSKTEVISLHAAGLAQVRRVRQAIVSLQDVFPVMRVTPTPKAAVIRVDIEYRKNSLEESLLQDDVATE